MKEYSGNKVEYQIGANDINQDTALKGSESIQFDFENAAIFKRLADDIYDSPEAGIREPLQNALTAVKRAIYKEYISDSEGIIKIEVKDGERVELILQDNGIGITEDVLNKVLTVIGRSQNRDRGNVSGKYGMGFLACYKLVGPDGGFIMHTNSRKENENAFSGIWKPGLFEKDNEEYLPSNFRDNNYGTRFEFKLQENISIEDVRKWVYRHSEWATIPIIYREFDDNNEIEFDNEFGIKNLIDEHKDSNFVVTIDNEYYTAICSREKEGRTLLINSPINRNSSYNSDISSKFYITNPNSMDIRLKNENGVVVKGPNKGLMPVSEAEYKNLSEERKEKYIPESKLNLPTSTDHVMNEEIDILLPQPTGTRETLEINEYFWAYLEKRMLQKIKSKFNKYMKSVSKPSDFLDLPTRKKKYLVNAIFILNIQLNSISTVKSEFEDKFNVSLSDNLAEFFQNINEEVYYVKRGSSAGDANKKDDSSNYKKKIGHIVSEINDGNVFMGVTMNQTKMNAVWEENDDNVVVRIENSQQYNILNELYDWKKLKFVKKHIDLNSVNQFTKKSLLNKSKKSSTVKNKEIESRKMTVHTHTMRNNLYLSSIHSRYNKSDSEQLVLFLSNSEYNVSDYYHMKSEDVSIATSLVKMWDYLKDSQNVTTIEDWLNIVTKYEFKTSEGIYSAKELKETSKQVIFHVVDDNINVFNNENIMQKMKNIKNNYYLQNKKDIIDNLDKSNILYVPITSKKLNHIKVLFKENIDNIYTINTNNKTKIGNLINISNSNLYWYAWSILPEWRNTDKIKTFKMSDYEITEEWVDIITNIKNNKFDTVELPNLEKEMKYITDVGEKTLSEMYNNYELILVHILQKETALLFKNKDIIKEIKLYVYNNEEPYTSYYTKSNKEKINTQYDLDDIVYVPVTKGEYRDMKNYDKTYTVSQKNVYSSCDGRIKNDSLAYAFAVLDKKIYDILVQNDNAKIKSLYSGGLEFIENIKESSNNL